VIRIQISHTKREIHRAKYFGCIEKKCCSWRHTKNTQLVPHFPQSFYKLIDLDFWRHTHKNAQDVIREVSQPRGSWQTN
jgi:hypothetical protein